MITLTPGNNAFIRSLDGIAKPTIDRHAAFVLNAITETQCATEDSDLAAYPAVVKRVRVALVVGIVAGATQAAQSNVSGEKSLSMWKVVDKVSNQARDVCRDLYQRKVDTLCELLPITTPQRQAIHELLTLVINNPINDSKILALVNGTDRDFGTLVDRPLFLATALAIIDSGVRWRDGKFDFPTLWKDMHEPSINFGGNPQTPAPAPVGWVPWGDLAWIELPARRK